ncbi:MAG: 8-amino-7-oxononanoate synthase [Chloroflexales bacterium]|nr:8-amino-7-oxononanoate synthase [Chloroflexales bacterium]
MQSLQLLQRRLDTIHERHLYRQPRVTVDGAEPWITINGQRLLNLSSNNYLGLATHPGVKAAAAAATQQGCGAGASRLIAGTFELHGILEERIARFKGDERALLFSSGYVANLSVIAALAGPGDLILSDALNHASLIDGCRLSRAECQVYPHCDLNALEALLTQSTQSSHARLRLVVTDTVFSMDGDIAPLAEIVELCRRYDALLLVDEAHATGCLGPGGRGLIAQLGLPHSGIITMSTLSKALGGFGACVSGDSLIIEYLVNTARGFIFTTALPPTVIAAALAALDILEREPQRAEQLQAHGAFLRRGLQAMGFNTLASTTQIVPVLVGDSVRALRLAEALRQAGVFTVAIRPPTVPPGAARVRACVMATHEREDIAYALEAFGRVGRRLNMVE